MFFCKNFLLKLHTYTKFYSLQLNVFNNNNSYSYTQY